MHRFGFTLATAATLLACPLAAEGQLADSLRAGMRVRVTTDSTPRQVRGVVESVDERGLRLRMIDEIRILPMQRITAVDVARGTVRVPGGAGRGALTGAIIGAIVTVVGTTAAIAYDFQDDSDAMFPASPLIAAYGVAFTAVTTGVGALIGGLPRQRWVRVWP